MAQKKKEDVVEEVQKTVKLSACGICEREFPSRLLTPFVTSLSSAERQMNICPICAKNLRNAIHGLPSGEEPKEAQDKAMLDEARAFIARANG